MTTGTARSRVAEVVEPVIFDSRLREEREWWRERLAALRDRRPRPGPEIARPRARASFRVEGPSFDRAVRITGGSDFLLYVLLLAAWKACLHRRRDDRVTVVASPLPVELAEAGAPPNLLPIIDGLDPETSFRSLLGAVRQGLLEAYARPRYPWTRMAEEIGLAQAPGALFDSVAAMAGLHAEPPPCDPDTRLTLRREADALVGEIDYAVGPPADGDGGALAEQLTTLLADALEHPDTPLGRLRLMTEAQRRVV